MWNCSSRSRTMGRKAPTLFGKSHEKSPYDISIYKWFIGILIDSGLLQSPHNWYKLNNQGYFHCSTIVWKLCHLLSHLSMGIMYPLHWQGLHSVLQTQTLYQHLTLCSSQKISPQIRINVEPPNMRHLMPTWLFSTNLKNTCSANRVDRGWWGLYGSG